MVDDVSSLLGMAEVKSVDFTAVRPSCGGEGVLQAELVGHVHFVGDGQGLRVDLGESLAQLLVRVGSLEIL